MTFPVFVIKWDECKSLQTFEGFQNTFLFALNMPSQNYWQVLDQLMSVLAEGLPIKMPN